MSIAYGNISKRRAIKQLVYRQHESYMQQETLFALCTDNSVWAIYWDKTNQETSAWVRLPDIPEEQNSTRTEV